MDVMQRGFGGKRVICRLLLLIVLVLFAADIFVFKGTYVVRPIPLDANTISQAYSISPDMGRWSEWESNFTFDPFMVGGSLLILAVVLKGIFGSCSRGMAA